jgi:GTP-binding protein
MRITKAAFLVSSAKMSQCPQPNKPEYAFIGRSNVGKSSLINMLCDHGGLAKISSKPGKTQLINHFIINENWYLVDLPGYGYAKVSKSMRAQFEKMISEYILKRNNLQCVFVLIDARHDPQELDLMFMENLAENGIPFCMVFTKCDKLSKRALPKQIESYTNTMLESWEEMPKFFLTSAESKRGKEEILDWIEAANNEYEPIR